MNSAFSSAISTHAFHPADSFLLTKWLRPRRSDASFATFSAHIACHPIQPRLSSRFIRKMSALLIALAFSFISSRRRISASHAAKQSTSAVDEEREAPYEVSA